MLYTPELATLEPSVTDLKVVSWNASNAFSEGRSKEDLDEAFKAIKAFGKDVQVLGIAELASGSSSPDHLAMIQERMAKEGFDEGRIENGVRKDELRVGIFARNIPCKVGCLALSGIESDKDLYVPKVDMPNLTITMMHQPSDSRLRRSDVAKAFVDAVAKQGDTEDKGFLAIGDWNETYASDSMSTRVMRILDPIVRQVPKAMGGDTYNYFDETKRLQRAIGTVARACAMTQADALKVLLAHGFEDAAPSGQSDPTVHLGPLDMRVDHGLTKNLLVRGYAVLDRPKDKDKRYISDHSPIAMTVSAKR